MAKVGRHRQESHAHTIARLQSWIDQNTKAIGDAEAGRKSFVHDGRNMTDLYIAGLHKKNDEWRKLIEEYSTPEEIKPETKVRKKYTWRLGKSPQRAKRGKARNKYTKRTGKRPPRVKGNEASSGDMPESS